MLNFDGGLAFLCALIILRLQRLKASGAFFLEKIDVFPTGRIYTRDELYVRDELFV